MTYLTAENRYIQLIIKYSFPLLILGIISRTFSITSSFYFIVPVLLIINILIFLFLIPRQNKDVSYFIMIILFPVYCSVTALWSLNPDISIQRALYLLLIYAGLFSSVFINRYFYDNATGIEFLLPANILILILSLVSLLSGVPDNSWTGGNASGFMGFAGHQNTLAAALLFTLPGVFALRAERPVHRVKGPDKSGFPLRSNIEQSETSSFSPLTSRFLLLSAFILLLASNLLFLALSYSRASILAFAIGIITYLLITRSKNILTILLTAFTFLFVLYLTFTPLKNSIDNVLNKNSGNILDRRTVLWKPSLEAAKLGGFFGLGYGVSAPEIKTPQKSGSHFEDGRYIREKGNSVLAMIEETGYIGLLLFLLPVILLIKKFKIENSKFKIAPDHSTFYIVNCTLLAMFIHAQFEGWWVGVGSVSLPLFLIFLFLSLLPNNLSQKAKENN